MAEVHLNGRIDQPLKRDPLHRLVTKLMSEGCGEICSGAVTFDTNPARVKPEAGGILKDPFRCCKRVVYGCREFVFRR